jgi:hypothetical protein
MKLTLTLWMTLFAIVPASFAAEQTATPGSAGDPMAGWVPRKVTREQQDRKEIAAFMKQLSEAGKKGDLEAAAALVDFPVLMVTDDSKGEAMTDSWDRERWMEVMRPFYKPMPGVKMTDKPTVSMLTDSLAAVVNQWTMTAAKKTRSGRSAVLLVRKEGQWRIKSMMEGGWGDMMKEKPASASQAQPSEPAQASPATPPSGTGTTTSPPDQSGTGGTAPQPSSPAPAETQPTK